MDRNEIIDLILEHVEEPRNRGRLAAPDLAAGGGNPGCGDVISITLALGPDGRIAAVGWEGKGCNISMAGASLLSEDLLGKTPEEVTALPPDHLLDRIGRELAMTRPKCSTLALNVAKAAVRAGAKRRSG